MGLLKVLLLSVIYLFVKIGDVVSSFFHFVLSPIGSLLRLFKTSSFLSRDESSSTHVLYRSKRSFVPKFSISNALFHIFFAVVSILRFLVNEAYQFLIFCVRVVVAVLKSPFLLISTLRKRRKKEVEITFVQFRTKLLYFLFGGLFSFFFFFLPLIFIVFVSDLPHPSQLSHGAIPKTTKIFDRNGVLLYEIYVSQNRTPVSLSDVPESLVHATLAIEDKDFYSHPGFDVRGIGRAFYENTTTDTLQGGSTITQQLVKSALLSPEPTISRKVKELALSFWAERVYSKDEILEMYFNFVPYGGTAWGISAAAETYFDKDVSDLTLAESAFLAGLPRAPSVYSPFVGDGESWRARQKSVLDAMEREGYIGEEEAQDAYSQELAFSSHRAPLLAPHFVMYVRDLLIDEYGIGAVERGGLQVRTSLDIGLQREAEQVVSDEVARGEVLHITNGAALVTDPTNGDVLAMVGSHDYFDGDGDGNVNVTRMLRQPGSTIKLVTYALALESGYTEATLLDDSPLSIAQAGAPAYRPVNYDGEFHGRVPLRIALANSYNIPAVRIAQDLGADGIVTLGSTMGISSWESISNYGLSITLGGSEVTMLDLATAYGTIANKGEKIELDPVLEVSDANGRVISTKRATEGENVVSSATAYILSDILADNAARSREFGTRSPLYFPEAKVSVKTGTTDEKRDNWTVGYSGNRLVAVWVGNNDNTPMSPSLTSGLSGAAPIWHNIMEKVLVDPAYAAENLVPEDVVVRECNGRRLYLKEGTERDVRCSPNQTTFRRPIQTQ